MSAKEYNPAEVENLIQESWKRDNSYKASPSETQAPSSQHAPWIWVGSPT